MAPSTCLVALAIVVAAVDAAPTIREVHHLDTTAPSTCCTTTTPAPGSPVVVRRNILDLTSEEQSRFLSAIEKMQEPGYGGPFQMMEALHGHGPESACIHSARNFAHWHRIYLHLFEVKLQDAYEELYGSRNISIPYWDSYSLWLAQDTDSVFFFHSDVMPQAHALGAKANVQNIWGPTTPTESNAKKFYGKGFELCKKGKCPTPDKTLGKLWQHKSWPSMLGYLEMFVRDDLTWNGILTQLENIHNTPHLAVSGPMKPLPVAGIHIYFWLHHSAIDRLFESFIQRRIAIDGDVSVLEAEMAAGTGKNDLWTDWLDPFLKADGSQWTMSGTHNIQDFNYRYDTLFTADDVYNSVLYKSAARAKKVSSRTVRTAPLTSAVITFGAPAGSGCTLTEQQPTFILHFFLQPKAGPPLTLPTSTDQLVNATGYVGMLAHWGGWDASQRMARAPDDMTLYLEIELRPFDYDVIVLYDQDEEDDGPGPLLTTPTFWTGESACDGAVPVPDASWVSLDYLRVGGL